MEGVPTVPGTVLSNAERMVIQAFGSCLKELILEDICGLVH